MAYEIITVIILGKAPVGESRLIFFSLRARRYCLSHIWLGLHPGENKQKQKKNTVPPHHFLSFIPVFLTCHSRENDPTQGYLGLGELQPWGKGLSTGWLPFANHRANLDLYVESWDDDENDSSNMASVQIY